MIINMAGGGGAGLNFDVKAYYSEEAMLSSAAKENTIGIVTSVISEWCFSATEPEYPTVNMVWIQTGASGQVAFNALKKNRVMVYPISAKQYVSGAWVDVTAKSFQNGAWQDWVRYLYINLDSDTWTSSQITGNGGSHTAADGVLKVTKNGSAAPNAITRVRASTKEKVDFSGYTTLEIEMSLSRTDCEEVIIGVNDKGTSWESKWLASTKISQSTEKTIYSVDIIGIATGHIAIDLFGNNGSTTATITAVRLVGEGGSVSPSPSVPEGVATFNLNRDANTTVLAEIDGVTYGIENATVNEGPTETTYDFTVL